MPRRVVLYAALLLALAVAQLTLGVRALAPVEGPWFLFGTDTIFHDALVHLWIQQQWESHPGVIPLWLPGLQGGLPTVGAFLWTPFSPAAWWFLAAPYPWAQWLAWLTCLWVAGLGGWFAARTLRLPPRFALLAGAGWMLSGHMVTLIHAGHFQKVAALAWLGFAVGGGGLLGRGRLAPGIAAAAGGVGMMFLAGHPQIAWLAATMVGALAFWGTFTGPSVRWSRTASGLAAAALLAGLLGGAQLLPGMQMAAESNRAGGVSLAEAAATSYPPEELIEFLWPGLHGSSVAGGTYRGRWGERIVSDYAGLAVVLLAGVALLGARRRGPVLPLTALGVFWMLVGLGSHLPLFGWLRSIAPGFASFRSPATFFAATAIVLPLLAACGLRTALARLRWRGTRARVAAALVLAVVALDLGRANRHYLLAFSWERFRADFLAPTELDLHLAEVGAARFTHDAASELSLRPLLYGRPALNGYHPLTYRVKQRQDEALGFNSSAWFSAWGITHVVVPLERADTDATPFPAQRRAVVRIAAPPADHAWLPAPPNERRVRVEGSAVVLPGTWTPEWIRDGRPAVEAPATTLTVPAQAAAGTMLRWEYRPAAWTVGVFFTALGAGVLSFLMTNRRRPLHFPVAGKRSAAHTVAP